MAGADLALSRESSRAYAGIVVLDLQTMDTLDEASAAMAVRASLVRHGRPPA